MKITAALVMAILVAASPPVEARIKRSAVALHQFVQKQACPATGLHRLPCPGYQIDHKVPLKCHGADAPDNLQWLTIQAHKEKTRREARHCR
jgi:5-methylcytosine-specific restriction endonuclease McrA